MATQAQTWRPIDTAPADVIVLVGWTDNEGQDRHEFDYLEDGTWMTWHENREHMVIAGGHGIREVPPYTHWARIEPLPSATAIPSPQPAPEGALAPCPFCGGAPFRSEGWHADKSPWAYIQCDKCEALAEPDVWNRRAPAATRAQAQQPAPLGALAGALGEIRAYLAEEADFNRSWTDGRRGPKNPSPLYVARRIQLAEQREAWCKALAEIERIDRLSAPVGDGGITLSKELVDRILSTPGFVRGRSELARAAQAKGGAA